MWVLGIEPGSFGKVASVLNCYAISPIPRIWLSSQHHMPPLRVTTAGLLVCIPRCLTFRVRDPVSRTCGHVYPLVVSRSCALVSRALHCPGGTNETRVYGFEGTQSDTTKATSFWEHGISGTYKPTKLLSLSAKEDPAGKSS